MQQKGTFRLVALAVPLAVLAIGTAGCSDDGGTDPDDEPTASMEAVVDGEPWAANQALDEPIASYSGEGTLLQLFATEVDGEGTTRRITIHVLSYESPGEYALAGSESEGFGHFIIEGDPDRENILYGTTADHDGTIMIEELDAADGWIEGTFEFVGVDEGTGETVTVTGGRFSGGIEQVPGPT